LKTGSGIIQKRSFISMEHLSYHRETFLLSPVLFLFR